MAGADRATRASKTYIRRSAVARRVRLALRPRPCDAATDGFTYVDDAFCETSQAAYASGTWVSGTLQITLGGIDDVPVKGISGGFATTFTLTVTDEVRVSFLANLTQTGATSVRFIFWNNEETGLNGSNAYVNTRKNLQGIESPAGSGLYPEPTWLGIVQHDQILFDHGLPPQPDQIPAADIDIEYQAVSAYAAQSLALANKLLGGNQAYSTSYPAEVGNNMKFTDSWGFRNFTASVSVRDNKRVDEIGMGSNPHWHAPTDVYAAYSEADFLLGFNTLQMTLGTIAELAGAH